MPNFTSENFAVALEAAKAFPGLKISYREYLQETYEYREDLEKSVLVAPRPCAELCAALAEETKENPRFKFKFELSGPDSPFLDFIQFGQSGLYASSTFLQTDEGVMELGALYNEKGEDFIGLSPYEYASFLATGYEIQEKDFVTSLRTFWKLGLEQDYDLTGIIPPSFSEFSKYALLDACDEFNNDPLFIEYLLLPLFETFRKHGKIFRRFYCTFFAALYPDGKFYETD